MSKQNDSKGKYIEKKGDWDFSLKLEIPKSCIDNGNLCTFIKNVIIARNDPQKEAINAFSKIEALDLQKLKKACSEQQSVHSYILSGGDKNFSIDIKIIDDDTETFVNILQIFGEKIEQQIKLTAEKTRCLFENKINDLNIKRNYFFETDKENKTNTAASKNHQIGNFDSSNKNTKACQLLRNFYNRKSCVKSFMSERRDLHILDINLTIVDQSVFEEKETAVFDTERRTMLNKNSLEEIYYINQAEKIKLSDRNYSAIFHV